MNKFWKDDRKSQIYPVAIENPTFSDVFTNIPLKSWAMSTIPNAACFSVGWLVGKHWRFPTAVFLCSLSVFGTVTTMWTSSFSRLKGYHKNDEELKKYGITKKEVVQIVRKRKILDVKNL